MTRFRGRRCIRKPAAPARRKAIVFADATGSRNGVGPHRVMYSFPHTEGTGYDLLPITSSFDCPDCSSKSDSAAHSVRNGLKCAIYHETRLIRSSGGIAKSEFQHREGIPHPNRSDDVEFRERGHFVTPLLPLLLATALGSQPTDYAKSTSQIVIPIEGSSNQPTRYEPYDPQYGDILLFCSKSPIRGTFYNVFFGGVSHVAIVIPSRDGHPMLLETPQVGSRVEITEIPTQISDYSGSTRVRRRSVPITADQAYRLRQFGYTQLGKPYDFVAFSKVGVSIPTRMFGPRRITEQELNTSTWFCSSLVAAAGISAGLLDQYTIRPHSVAPSDFHRDRSIDLSDGWHPAVPLIAIKKTK